MTHGAPLVEAPSTDGAVCVPVGVMDASYAHARQRPGALDFRLRSRAAVVARAWARQGSGSPPRLLEVGAADGRTLAEIARRIGVGEYVGVERDPGLIDASPPLPRNVRLVQGDAMHLPEGLESDSFDVVAMMAVLEHLPDPVAAVTESVRVLRRDGLLVASCPNPFWDSVAGRLGLVAAEHHVGRFDLARLRALLAEAGLEVREAKRFMWAPVAALPYAGWAVSPDRGLAIDAWVEHIPLASSLCVNGYVVGAKV